MGPFEKMVNEQLSTAERYASVEQFFKSIEKALHGPKNADQVEMQAGNYYSNNQQARRDFKNHKKFAQAVRKEWEDRQERG